MESEAPTATELEAHPVVRAAFAAAWADSFPDDPALRHEEGGFVYYNPTNADVAVRRVLPGRKDELRLPAPPVLQNYYVVATFHTHPNPSSEGWIPDPSPEDREGAYEIGVPWFVVTEFDVFVAGPERRVGGLNGPSGYPQ